MSTSALTASDSWWLDDDFLIDQVDALLQTALHRDNTPMLNAEYMRLAACMRRATTVREFRNEMHVFHSAIPAVAEWAKHCILEADDYVSVRR